MTQDTTQDWIVTAHNGRYYVLDNESLKQDGIIAHAIHSVHDDIRIAKQAQQALLEGDTETARKFL